MTTTGTTVRGTTRFEVPSADGTRLVVWAEGIGPALVLVHGSPNNHTTFDPLVDALRGELTCFAMDRRGSVALLGHSYGCNPAMGGATLTSNVHHLVLYEPSFGLAYPPGAIETIERAVAAGDREGSLHAALVDTGAMTTEEFRAFETSPRWPTVLDAVTPALPRECLVEHAWEYRPGQFDAITAPTLLLTGSQTAPDLAELTARAGAAIPNAQIRRLEGHGHFAFKTDPIMVAGVVREFLTSSPRRA